MLKCSICGSPVEKQEDELVRSCSHIDASVVAEMTATAYGQGACLDLLSED
jgi:hypothetical protein